MMSGQKQSGFTLIEISIVLLIVTIILGYTVGMYPIQQELKQYRQADQEMDRIIASLYAFAQVNGYLPCPAAANTASSGFECRDVNADALLCEDGAATPPDPAADSCDIWFGFVPGKTLGIQGRYSEINGLLLDPWGQPYRYQVTDIDAGTGVPADFVMVNGMSEETIANLGPDLSVCNEDPSPGVAGTGDVTCNGAPQTVVIGLPAVILSTGKNTAGNVAGTSWRQRENLDNTPTDRAFISRPFDNTQAGEYDDLVKWISPNVLYSKMIEAGQL